MNETYTINLGVLHIAYAVLGIGVLYFLIGACGFFYKCIKALWHNRKMMFKLNAVGAMGFALTYIVHIKAPSFMSPSGVHLVNFLLGVFIVYEVLVLLIGTSYSLDKYKGRFERYKKSGSEGGGGGGH